MKKTLVTILVVLVLVLALGIAGFLGYNWYRDNHVFVEGDVYDITLQSLDLTDKDISVAYYDELQEKLPNCGIRWMVPFHGGKYANDTESLAVSELTLEDVEFITKYFILLENLDASQCDDYDVLAVAEATLTNCEVIYDVDLSVVAIDHNAASLEIGFSETDDFEKLMANLIYLPKLESLKLKDPELSLEQVESLRTAYPQITVTHTVEVYGLEYDVEATTELDLSGITGPDVAQVSEQIKKLPNLTYVNLNPENGIGALSLEDVKNLMDAVPDVVFDFTFDFYGDRKSVV